MAIKLSRETLPQISDNVTKPNYDQSAVTPGIIHIGVGNFHRAHQAVYLDDLFSAGGAKDWGIVGAGVRSADKVMRDDLSEQDFLTTVVELDPAGLTARICGSMIGFVEPGSIALIDALAAPEIRIVSLTVTEGGYYIDATNGGFDRNHPDILADVENPDTPETVFGIIVAALSRRREAGLAPFTVMSCDNLPGNGHAARQAVVGLAQASSPETAAWIKKNVTFPNGMVDCITPATSDRERKLVTDTFGIKDTRPVVCEPFRQWVLEDKFIAGRPALETVGVEFVTDVAPYELMKLRILNGGHATLAYPAALLDIDLVHDAMADQQVREFLRRVVHEEIIPAVPKISGVDFNDYFQNVETRFSNSVIGDTIPRLCQDGSNRQPKFILPSIADRIEAGASIQGLALEVAFWCRYCAGKSDSGREIEIDDPMAKILTDRAHDARKDPTAFLNLDAVFGSLGQDDAFRSSFSVALNRLWRDGVRSTLGAYLNGELV